MDDSGNLFIADADNQRVRMVTAAGTISTVAGNGLSGIAGDGGPARSAMLNHPSGVAVDSAGNLFIADTYNARIRMVARNGVITTIAGSDYGDAGDGGLAVRARLASPAGLALDSAGNLYVADWTNSRVRMLRRTGHSTVVTAVVDAASQRATGVSPGKMVVIYGEGLGPAQLVQNTVRNGRLSSEVGGTSVFFNGTVGPILYSSATQVAAIVPYAVSGTTVQVTVGYRGDLSEPFAVPLTPASPSLFTANQTGGGQAACVNVADGTVNSAVRPVKIGEYVALFATGEGQTAPSGVDGAVGGPNPVRPVLPVTAEVDGVPATVQYAGGVFGQIAGLLQVNVQIPDRVRPGGYVPLVLRVGQVSSSQEVWVAVARN